MGELHRHCQCDNCTGEDCGQDNPDKLKAEQEAAQKEHDDLIRKEILDKAINKLQSVLEDPNKTLPWKIGPLSQTIALLESLKENP